MTNQEAIKILTLEIIKNNEPHITKLFSAYNLSISALKKQIPLKPLPCKITEGRCKCGVGFIDKLTNYCGNCGQKLDWSK